MCGHPDQVYLKKIVHLVVEILILAANSLHVRVRCNATFTIIQLSYFSMETFQLQYILIRMY